MQFQHRNEGDAHLVQRAAGSDSAEIAAEIAAGTAEFFTLGALHIVTRAEITTRGRELVIVCIEGADIIKPIRLLVKVARELGYQFLRYHPATKGRGAATARIAQCKATWIEEPQAAYYIVDLRGDNGQ